MKTYKTYQWNYIITIVMPVIMLWVIAAWYYQIGSNPMPLYGMLIMEFFLLLALLLFYGLTIYVSDKEIRLKFGIGIIHFRFELNDIKETKLVKNPWYYGIGIRFIPNGRLYNAHGLKAVELSFHSRNKIARIGASNTQELKREIDTRRKGRKSRMS